MAVSARPERTTARVPYLFLFLLLVVFIFAERSWTDFTFTSADVGDNRGVSSWGVEWIVDMIWDDMGWYGMIWMICRIVYLAWEGQWIIVDQLSERGWNVFYENILYTSNRNYLDSICCVLFLIWIWDRKWMRWIRSIRWGCCCVKTYWFSFYTQYNSVHSFFLDSLWICVELYV